MDIKRALVLFGVISLAACGKGGSSPTGPDTSTLPVAAGFRITAVAPAIYGTESQSITVTGTNFGSGMTLSVQPPGPPTPPFVFPMLQGLTATSFTVFYKFAVFGNYTFTLSGPGETAPAFTVTPQYRTSGATWIPEGVRLTDVTAGYPGRAFADAAVFQLNDGRWRVLIDVGGAIRSAISPDGLSMTMEPGERLPSNVPGMPRLGLVRVIRLDDGRVRLFASGAPPFGGIYSAISTDEGLTWTIESGVRVAAEAGSTGLSVVRLRDGRWRGYWSTGSCVGKSCGTVFSATSTDMLNWTQDAGVRIGTGATITGDASHPKALANSDGSITLFYWGTRTVLAVNTMVSTSSDGLSFGSESVISSLGNTADPEVVRVGNGLRLYYNWGDSSGGALFSAFSANGATSLLGGAIR